MSEMESALPSDPQLADLQREVQRKLGACLLNVQRYERHLKSLPAHAAFEGNLDELEAARAKALAAAHKKTLGTLVKDFCEDHLVSTDHIAEAEDKDVIPSNISPENPWFGMRFQLVTSPQGYQKTKAALAEMTSLRNGLVHHFLERFDIWDVSGCIDAQSHLDQCNATFNQSYLQLHDWVVSIDSIRASVASVMQTGAFTDCLVNGINPDGTILWPVSGIVQALREAQAGCAVDGWAQLDTAIRWLRTHHPEQIPSKYACKSWQQVLTRSGQFEIVSRQEPITGRGQTWFREKA